MEQGHQEASRGSLSWWASLLGCRRQFLHRTWGTVPAAQELRRLCRRRLEARVGRRWRGGPAGLHREALRVAALGRVRLPRPGGVGGRPTGVPAPGFLAQVGLGARVLRGGRVAARAIRKFWRRIADPPGRTWWPYRAGREARLRAHQEAREASRGPRGPYRVPDETVDPLWVLGRLGDSLERYWAFPGRLVEEVLDWELRPWATDLVRRGVVEEPPPGWSPAY